MTDTLEDDLFSHNDELAGLKVPPHSLEAEQSVVGAQMIDKSQWDNGAEILLPDDFYRNEHRQVYRMMIRLAEQTQPLDVITLGEALDNEKQLDAVGGMEYLCRPVLPISTK